MYKNYESGTFILFNFPIHHPVFSNLAKSLFFPVILFFLAFIPLLIHKMSGLHLIIGKFPLSYKMLLLFAAL